MGAVVAHAAGAGGQLADGVALDHPVEVVVAERAHGVDALPHQELGAGAGALDDGDEGDRAVVVDGGVPGVVDGVGHGGHQSRGSMNRWIVPPQVRPTAKASSSL